MSPLTSGEYPSSMRSLVGERLPKFSKKQAGSIKGSFDFIGLNYYSANYVAHKSQSNDTHPSYETDSHVASFCKNEQLQDGFFSFLNSILTIGFWLCVQLNVMEFPSVQRYESSSQ